MTQHNEPAVSAHYSRGELGTAILDALRAAGKNVDTLTVDDLALVDQFHIRGKQGTLDLIQRAGFTAGMRVLDVGGGIGGPARTLASDVDCHVTVLDLTEEYCRVGEMLTARTGLNERVIFRHGSALALPFPNASFDAVWTQHSSMNIADKEKLYTEIARVLRPHGRLAIHEVMAGPVSPIHFPVPWAREQAISFLRPPEAVRTLIRSSGFSERAWVDETRIALEWFEQRVAAAANAPQAPPVGLHLLLGADFAAMFSNMMRNLQEQRVMVIQAVFERP